MCTELNICMISVIILKKATFSLSNLGIKSTVSTSLYTTSVAIDLQYMRRKEKGDKK